MYKIVCTYDNDIWKKRFGPCHEIAKASSKKERFVSHVHFTCIFDILNGNYIREERLKYA